MHSTKLALCFALLTGLAASFLAPACSYCTEVGCGGELPVFAQLPTGFDATSFTLTVHTSEQESQVFECGEVPEFGCTPVIEGGVAPTFSDDDPRLIDIRVLGGNPESVPFVRVEVANDAGAFAQAQAVTDYVEFFPNGAGCPPGCFESPSLSLTLEEAAP